MFIKKDKNASKKINKLGYGVVPVAPPRGWRPVRGPNTAPQRPPRTRSICNRL